MRKDAFYFSHDSNARYDEKMLQLRAVYKGEGYGWYWIIIEMMRDANAYRLQYDSKYAFAAIAKELDCTEDIARQFIDNCINEFKLFELDDGFFFSKSLLQRMEVLDEKREKARSSARARWDNDANAMRTHNKRNASKVNKSKVKESKEKKNNDADASLAAPTTSSYGSAVLRDIEVLKTECLADQVNFVEHICRQTKISHEGLPKALIDFNSYLKSLVENAKTEKDYRQHFQNWLRKQDLSKYGNRKMVL